MATEQRSDAPDGSPASLRRRALAYVVDAVAVLAVAGAVGRRRSGGRRSSGDREIAAALATGVAGGTLYHVVLETATGRTVGKAVAGIAVRAEGGGPASGRAVLVRTLLRAVDWLPAGYLLGALSILANDEHQRVGDRVAGTVVVTEASREAAERDARGGSAGRLHGAAVADGSAGPFSTMGKSADSSSTGGEASDSSTTTRRS